MTTDSTAREVSGVERRRRGGRTESEFLAEAGARTAGEGNPWKGVRRVESEEGEDVQASRFHFSSEIGRAHV